MGPPKLIRAGLPILTMEDLKEVYNNLVHKWTETKPEETWGIEEANRFIQLIKKGRILDLGCAAGAHSKYFSEAGLDVVGIDFAEKMVSQAKLKVPKAKFLVMNIVNLQFPVSYFDGVYARASLLHLPKSEIKKVLKDLQEILRKKGIIYVALKEGEGEREIFDEEEKVSRFFAFYKEDEINELLTEAGFVVFDTSFEKTNHNNWIQILARKD